MISFANWVCVILIHLIKSRISPGGSYEFNDAFVQWEKCIVFVILQQHTRISVEKLRRFDDIICELGLCNFNWLDQIANFSWWFLWM